MMLTSALLPLLLIAATPGPNWPGFRGDGTSVSSLEQLPLRWSDDSGIAWKADLADYGQSSPVVWGDLVFVTSAAGESKETDVVRCVELATGKTRWEREFAATQKVMASDYVSRAAPTPVVDREHVFAFFESGDLAALDHAGQEMWRRSLTAEYGEFKGNHGVGASLAQTDDLVIVLADHDGPSYLLAIEKSTGKNRWKLDREPRVSWSSPVIASGPEPQIIVSSAGIVEAYRAADGKAIWSLEGLEGNTVPSATVAGDLILVGSGDAGHNLALRRDRSGKLADGDIAWRLKNESTSFSSLLAYQGRVFMVNRAGAAFCVDQKDGKVLWTHRLSGSCWASPLGGAGRVYFFGKDGVTTVIKADAAEFESLAENRLTVEDRVYGVAAVPGAFVLRTGSKLICVGKPQPPAPSAKKS